MADLTAIGNLGADAELKQSRNGSSFLSFSIRDSKSKKNDQGGWDEIKGQWLRVTVWGSLAEQLFNSGLPKGSRVKITGEFFSREFDGQNGPGVALDVEAWGVKVLNRPTENSSSGAAHQTGAYGVPQSNQPPQSQHGGGWGAQPPQGNGVGWGNQPPQQQQPPAQNAPQQNSQPQQGGWNQPSADPWSAQANPGGGWGNPQ